MDHSLPPFSALRAFEAAARLSSFQLAADELSVTPSAISYQIRNLEEAIGKPLFLRHHRRVSLTPAGKTFLTYVDRGFSELRHGVAAVRSVRDPHVLRITAAPAFASAILTQRLHAFQSANPRVDVQLVIARSMLDLAADAIDVAIRLSIDPPAELWCQPIARLMYTPVCVPSLAAKLRAVDDLSNVTRITVREHAQGWENWFVGCRRSEPRNHQLEVETMNVSLQMALDGQGVSLLPRIIVAEHLATGRLVAPYPHELESRSCYWAACRRGDEKSAKVRRFVGWLTDELRELQADHQSASAE